MGHHRARTPVSGPYFLARNLVKCGICYAKVCLSVRPSVTLVSHALSKCALDHTIEGRF